MMNTLITTDAQLQECVEKRFDVVIWLFGKCDGTAKLIDFTDYNVKTDNGFWYVRRHCRLYA
jgi:hypothetical protein